ncbi:unnamed protein product [Brassicogethes aeneus]|uniref:Uncharacterized protein n=1 Tax=Brassicogethes aeneus TaxID=1431903 RepID=A0A9P0FKK7_BRAAE|nr:unnamed protein product [Brassicogethes aeneus]
MEGKYSTALSHLVLAGTGAYCLKSVYGGDLKFSHGCFGIIIVNNLLGLWTNGNPRYGDSVYKIFRITREMQDLFVLPFVTTTLWLNYSYRWEYSYAHAIAPVFPFITFLVDKKAYELTNLILTCSLASMTVISFLHDNYYGLVASVSYMFDYFLKKEDNETFLDIPTQDLSNYIMCFFAYFSLHAMLD